MESDSFIPFERIPMGDLGIGELFWRKRQKRCKITAAFVFYYRQKWRRNAAKHRSMNSAGRSPKHRESAYCKHTLQYLLSLVDEMRRSRVSARFRSKRFRTNIASLTPLAMVVVIPPFDTTAFPTHSSLLQTSCLQSKALCELNELRMLDCTVGILPI